MKGYLLDTMAVSDAIKPRRNRGLATWLGKTDPGETYLSVLTVGELQKGISLLERGSEKRAQLERWLIFQLVPTFGNRILQLDVNVARLWGELTASAQARGAVLPIVDSQIAATALLYGLTVVTHNERHYKAAGVKTLNPWSG